MTQRPSIALILVDDLGFSDIGCYGGESHTPALDRLAPNGVRMTSSYNTSRGSPSRAALLTGLHPHRVGVGILTADDTPEGYPGNLSGDCVTLPEALQQAGYGTYATGKWHLANNVQQPNGAWPTQRGFDHYYGTLEAGSYYQPRTLMWGGQQIEHEAHNNPDFYFTDAITDNAVAFIYQHLRARPENPFLPPSTSPSVERRRLVVSMQGPGQEGTTLLPPQSGPREASET